jgi:hypothetical protein
MRCASGLRLQWFVLTVILARDTEPAKRCGSFGAPPHVIHKLRTGHVLPVPHRARVGEVPLLLSKTKRSDHDIPDQEQPNCGRHRWLATHLGRAPPDLQIADIDADLVGGFLSFIETTRGNGARSRNARLSAIRSFFRYVAVNEPHRRVEECHSHTVIRWPIAHRL